jgi:DNA helicase-2/ATP-dependent DNA helicase PcrA
MNGLTLAVAGSRKTQSIVDACASSSVSRRLLVLGYPQASQSELEGRIKKAAPFRSNVDVCGWYAFLLRHFVRPYLPLKYPGHRLTGFNFDGEPAAGFYASGAPRFLDTEDRAYRLHLSKLAMDVCEASQGAVIDRLEHIYHGIYIDEAQDLCGWDLDIVEMLFKSAIDIKLVGDMRQALLATNVRDRRHKRFRCEKVSKWFRLQEQAGLLKIVERLGTYRSNQIIASFSDSIFTSSCGYGATVSHATSDTGHDGIYAVQPAHVPAYRETFDPLCLRQSANSGRDFDLPFSTFGTAKGLTVDRVLIYPTANIRTFLSNGAPLEGKSACGLYIAVTRAKHSVAFILEPSDKHNLTIWTP